VPRLFLGKGSYFSFAGRPVFSRLIYPVPIPGGLGVHVTLDMAGRMRFGPDVEWIGEENYDVDATRAAAFYARIRLLARPPGQRSGAGLFRHQAEADGTERERRFHDRGRGAWRSRLVHLFGIESPGLTSALSLGEEIAGYLSA
jgi:L-2-hydroxyglutarate oxidase LhgO